MSVSRGDTYFFDPDPLGGGYNCHLWIVASVYEGELDGLKYAIIVNVTSMTNHADRTCVLGSNDHPFLSHESYVFYAKALQIEITSLPEKAKNTPVSAAVLGKVLAGVQQSKFTPRGIKKCC